MTELVQGNFTDEMKSRYLTYAMSTIMSRALPDVRDGLKPVHRRILFAMRMLKLNSDQGYKKSARVVGDVIGKYHPHGDQSVYDAMVRLAQDFAVRYPLVDGQGNFGNVDGDSAAAMRYTESRMTKVAEWIMKDLDCGTVDFRPTYDESEDEPIVMPGCFPNLLANGSSGIAVGLSTSIPPHNVGELCDAMVALLKSPNMMDSTLLNHIKGPDFPTGGVCVESAESIAQAYETGRGSFRVRAKWEVEELPRGQYQIVVTEIPYQVQKSKLIEKLADLINAKRVPWLNDVMDESDENVRIVLEPKNRNVDPNALMETLFKLSDLENRVSLNMNVITRVGTPALLSLKQALQQFLDHRREVLIRRSQWRLGKIESRLHILAAYMVVYLNIDEVIKIIKENDQPAPIMMERFGIDEVQAEAILNMRLRRLRKLEEIEIRKEQEELEAERDGLQAILASEELQTKKLIEESRAIKKEFADDRRTTMGDAPVGEVINLEAMIEKEPVTVLISQQGWVRTLKNHMAPDQEAKYKEGDEEAYRICCQTTDNICLMGTSGRFYTLAVSKLPSGRGFGEPLSLNLDFPQGEHIAAAFVPDADKYMLATEKGSGFIARAEALQAQVRSGKQVLNVSKGDAAKFCLPITANTLACLGSSRRMLVFAVDEVPELNRGKGVRLMALKGGSIEDMLVFNRPDGFGMNNTKGTRSRVFTDLSIWAGKRAQVGKLPPHGFQSGATFFLPEAGAVVENQQEEEQDDDRLDELIKAITSPKDFSDESDGPGLFDDWDD